MTLSKIGPTTNVVAGASLQVAESFTAAAAPGPKYQSTSADNVDRLSTKVFSWTDLRFPVKTQPLPAYAHSLVAQDVWARLLGDPSEPKVTKHNFPADGLKVGATYQATVVYYMAGIWNVEGKQSFTVKERTERVIDNKLTSVFVVAYTGTAQYGSAKGTFYFDPAAQRIVGSAA